MRGCLLVIPSSSPSQESTQELASERERTAATALQLLQTCSRKAHGDGPEDRHHMASIDPQAFL